MSRKFALVIGNTEYDDPGLMQLPVPRNDAADFARVLKDPNLCAFDDVQILLDQPSSSATEAIDAFFDQKKPDDLLVLYFSGHGVRDEVGSLYLAFKNTNRSRMRATAVKSDYLREAMDQSRSRRQVVVFDCCNSGVFPEGTKTVIGSPMGMATAFQGYGRFVLMASDAMQFAWEGNKVIGEAQDSRLTHFLARGLEGEADRNSDGKITVDELYDYAYEEIARLMAKQTPTKAASKVEGDIILRCIQRLEDIKAVLLPKDLRDEVDDTRPYVREAAVRKLEKILESDSLGLARSALAALDAIASDENSTRHVAEEAARVLDAHPPSKLMSRCGQEALATAEPLAGAETEQHAVIAVTSQPVAEVVPLGRAAEVPRQRSTSAVVRHEEKAVSTAASEAGALSRRAGAGRRALWLVEGAGIAAVILGIGILLLGIPGGPRRSAIQLLLPKRTAIPTPIAFTATSQPLPSQTAAIISTSTAVAVSATPTIASPTSTILPAASVTSAVASGVTVDKYKGRGGYYFQVNGGPYTGMQYGPLPDGTCAAGPNGRFAVYVDQNGVVYAARLGQQGVIQIAQLSKRDFSALMNDQMPAWQLQFIADNDGTYTLVVNERSYGDDHAAILLPGFLTR